MVYTPSAKVCDDYPHYVYFTLSKHNRSYFILMLGNCSVIATVSAPDRKFNNKLNARIEVEDKMGEIQAFCLHNPSLRIYQINQIRTTNM